VDTQYQAREVAVSGSHVYVTDTASGLQVIDIANPTSPQIVGSVCVSGDGEAGTVAGSGSVVCVGVAHPFRLQVFPAQCDGPPTGTGREQLGVSGASLRVYPNPFRDRSLVSFETTRSGPVRVEIFDVAGRLVRTLIDRPLSAGLHSTAWSGAGRDNVQSAPGVYFFRLEAAGQVQTQKVVRVAD
jgi:hypothetical protein